MLEAGKSLTTSGSALFLDTLTGIVDWYKNSPLGNMRGEVGEGDDGESDTGWDIEGDDPTAEEATPETDTSTPEAEEAPPADTEEPTPKDDEQQAEKEAPETETAVTPEMQAMQEQFDDLQANFNALQTKSENLQNVANFYQGKLNDVTKTKDVPVANTDPNASQNPNLPQEVVPPEKWDFEDADVFRQQMGGYIDHQTTIQNQNMQSAYEKTIVPMFERTGQALNMVVDQVFKGQNEDWDEVIGNVQKEIFMFDAEGKEVIGVKNQSVLDYFRAQPIPKLAMYNWGVGQKAPTKIKEGVKANTRKVIEKIAAKPKGPTKPGASERTDRVPDLGWDDPKDVAEQKLHKSGLI